MIWVRVGLWFEPGELLLAQLLSYCHSSYSCRRLLLLLLRTVRATPFMSGRKGLTSYILYMLTLSPSTACSFSLIRCKWNASFNFSLMGNTCSDLYFRITFLTVKPGRLWESLGDRTEWLLALWLLCPWWSKPTLQIKLVKMKGDNCSTLQKENRMFSCSFAFRVQNKTHLHVLTSLSRVHDGFQP